MTEPSKHRRRAAPKRAAARPSRAARPARAARGSRVREADGAATSSPFAWFTTMPGLAVAGVVGFVVVAVLLATGIKALFLDDDEDAGTKVAKGPGAVSASYGNQWTAADGSRYEISVQTLTDLVAVGSADACIAPPPTGMTNLHFNVVVTNLSKKRAAPVPRVLFGTNVRPSGVLVTSQPSFAKSNKSVQVTPLAKARTCADGAVLGPENREEIPPGESVTFNGTFGPVKQPIVGGITVIARFFEKDGSGEKPSDFLAPFGSFPATSSP